jgi:hypothetical protein
VPRGTPTPPTPTPINICPGDDGVCEGNGIEYCCVPVTHDADVAATAPAYCEIATHVLVQPGIVNV